MSATEPDAWAVAVHGAAPNSTSAERRRRPLLTGACRKRVNADTGSKRANRRGGFNSCHRVVVCLRRARGIALLDIEANVLKYQHITFSLTGGTDR